MYEYECERCGYKFDRLAKMSDPNPPCPCLDGPGVTNKAWGRFFTEAWLAFRKDRLVAYPGTGKEVGPDYEHTVIDLDGGEVTKTLGEWIEGLVSCGAPTKRLVSLSKFVLKGGGWAADGY